MHRTSTVYISITLGTISLIFFLVILLLNTAYKNPTIGQTTKYTTSVKNFMDNILQKILNTYETEKHAGRNEGVK